MKFSGRKLPSSVSKQWPLHMMREQIARSADIKSDGEALIKG